MIFKPFLTAEAISSLQQKEAQSSKAQKRTPEQIEAIYVGVLAAFGQAVALECGDVAGAACGVIGGGAAGLMAAGTAAGGWRIIKTLGHKMVRLQPVHGFAAETSSATKAGSTTDAPLAMRCSVSTKSVTSVTRVFSR